MKQKLNEYLSSAKWNDACGKVGSKRYNRTGDQISFLVAGYKSYYLVFFMNLIIKILTSNERAILEITIQLNLKWEHSFCILIHSEYLLNFGKHSANC